MKFAVLGGGSFGTVLAHLCVQVGNQATIWVRSPQIAEEINSRHTNRGYLEGIRLEPGVRAELDMAQAVRGADYVILSVVSRAFREVARQCVASLDDGCRGLISATKGIDVESGRFLPVSEVLAEELAALGRSLDLGVISGPNLAKEIAEGGWAGTIISSTSERMRSEVKEALSTDLFRVYTNADIKGVELGGILKNVYAITMGIARQLQVGSNAEGLLLTRSLHEMAQFAAAFGGTPLTFLGLAGVGDLFATANSPLSRNHRLGVQLAKGLKLDGAEEAMGGTAEGVRTVRLMVPFAREAGLQLPLAEALYRLMYEDAPMPEVLRDLMSFPVGEDVRFPAQGGSADGV